MFFLTLLLLAFASFHLTLFLFKIIHNMGRIGKLKSGSKGKLNQWKKGQSSSSNPQSKTYREKARGKFFQMQPTSRSNKGLTLEAVKIHDEIHDSQARYCRMYYSYILLFCGKGVMPILLLSCDIV